MNQGTLVFGFIIAVIVAFFFLLSSMFQSSLSSLGEDVAVFWNERILRNATATDELVIKSPAFEYGGDIPEKYSCFGERVNPPLVFEGVSSEAKSLVLFVHDIDSETEGGSYNWVVYNIPSWVTSVDSGSIPWSTEGLNSSGKIGYNALCNVGEKHTYNFTLFVLSSTLDLDEGATFDDVIREMKGKTIGTATLKGEFGKR